MILGLVALVALAIRLALYGSVRDFDSVRIRGEPPLVAILVLLFALPAVSAAVHPSRSLVVPLWLVLMVVLLCLCLLNGGENRGFFLMAAGVAFNLLVIWLNGGMPVSNATVLAVGGATGAQAVVAGDLFHSVMTSGTRLAFLGDVLPMPGFRGLRGALSVGDVLMYVGMVTVFCAYGSKSARRRASLGKD